MQVLIIVRDKLEIFLGGTITLGMEVHEQNQKRNIEENVEAPTPDARATTFPVEMIVEHPHQPNEA